MKRGSSGLNLLLGVDKPEGLSSHDVVNRVRGILKERRVGHAGTLDPAATGVMVVGVGQGTRLMGLLTAETKSYVATIAFGTSTNTDDAEGEVTDRRDVPETLEDPSVAKGIIEGFSGPQLQTPPSYSAISIDGKRAYRRARAGEDFDLAARPIDVKEAMLLDIVRRDLDDTLCWTCAFTVSKGTYIRAIARDLGVAAGTCAHLCALRRTASGTVTLTDCVTLDELSDLGAERVGEVCLDPAAALGLARCDLTPSELEDVICGRRLSRRGRDLEEGELVSMVHGGKLYGVWEARDRSVRSKVSFPHGIWGVGV